MKFKKYMHIERLGREEVEGLLNGTCYVFPKIDGTNSVVFLGDDGEIHAGSRRQELNYRTGLDNQGFMADIVNDEKIKAYLIDHPNHYIYGEWLVKHSIGYYNSDAWRKFYIFDVFDAETEKYISYDEYKPLLENYGITNIIPLMAKIINPTHDDIELLLKENKFLIGDSEERFGEGVVVKNYDFVNKYGRTVFGKIVAEEFFKTKSEHRAKNKTIKVEGSIEEQIINKFLTETMIEKEYQKLINSGITPSKNRGRFIGMFINQVWHEFLVEEIAEIDKKYKHPELRLFILRKLVENKIKEVKDDIF